jgi:SAM-dependent methyltransferase
MKNLFYVLYCRCAGIYHIARSFLKSNLRRYNTKPKVLDVGGRKSPYTVFLPIELTISDIPRESEVQEQLTLGFTDGITTELKKRSNVKAVIYDDMTITKLQPASFDGVITIEVIEHVPQDELFVKNIAGVLKPGGFLLLSTPNGEQLTVIDNPDHLRHYTKAQLEAILKKYFSQVDVYYAVPDTAIHNKSHKGLKGANPVTAIITMVSGFISATHTMLTYKNSNKVKVHLFAQCIK